MLVDSITIVVDLYIKRYEYLRMYVLYGFKVTLIILPLIYILDSP